MYSRVYVEITNICNMRCSFCHGHSRQPRTMTALEFAHILEQLEGKTQYVYYHLMGEPLLHPQLPELMKMAAQAGFKSVLTTNGTLLSKRGDALLQAGIPMRHQDENRVVSMYITDIDCVPSQHFSGKVVVSMRPIHRDQVELATRITAAMQWEKASRQ